MGGSAQTALIMCKGLADTYDTVLVHGLSKESMMTISEKKAVEKDIDLVISAGVKIMVLESMVRKINPLHDIKALWELVGIIRKERPDIVHTHTSKAGVLGRLAAAICRVPVVIHMPHGHVFTGHFNSVAAKVFMRTEQFMDKFTTYQVALTNDEKNDYLKFGIALPEKLVNIHSGVDIKKFCTGPASTQDAKKALGISSKKKVVGTVGWLLPIKGPMVLLKAMGHVWEKLPDVSLVFVGNGPLQSSLKSCARQLGALDKVHFLGWRDDVHAVMPAFDVFALASLNEGMGRVLVEAMAAGKPVVGSDVGGIRDLVHHGVNGLRVPKGDAQALGRAILQLLENKKKAKDMGKQGQKISQAYSIDAMLEKLDALYREALKKIE